MNSSVSKYYHMTELALMTMYSCLANRKLMLEKF